jgi:NAD(P)-dependent dehydrogenase (short-subunit alcohol dehydrogenase family)
MITTNFGFHSTADEVAAGINLSGKQVIVTGAASGIGVETARTLARTGAIVTLAVRNTAAGDKVAAEIIATTGNTNVRVAPLDLDDKDSINTFVTNWKGPLHILIHNAGIMAIPELQKTKQHVETQFSTNFLGPFALTLGLYEALKAAKGARVVVVSSSAHLLSPVVFDDINFSFRPYDPWLAYGQSKTAGILFTVEITEKWGQDGITANALNPGAIATNLQKYSGGLKTPPERRKNTQQGAATTLLVATSPLLEGIGGHYFENCNEAATVTKRPDNYEGVAPYALDKANAARLWETALAL